MAVQKQSANQVQRIEELQGYVRTVDRVRKLVAELGRVTKSRAKVPRDPHVSLVYKKIPHATKKGLVAVLRLPFRTVVFDSVAAVRMTLPVRTRADVENWKIVAKESLRR